MVSGGTAVTGDTYVYRFTMKKIFIHGIFKTTDCRKDATNMVKGLTTYDINGWKSRKLNNNGNLNK